MAANQGKRRSSKERIAEREGKVLGKMKMGKFVEWKVGDGRLQWRFKEEKVEAEEILDGCYIIWTDVSAEQLGKQEIVASHKTLTLVEQAFRNLKSVQLEVRPAYHKKDNRIRCHVFLCMLAYLHMGYIFSKVSSKIRLAKFSASDTLLRSLTRAVIKALYSSPSRFIKVSSSNG